MILPSSSCLSLGELGVLELVLQLPHDHFVGSLILRLLNHHLRVLQQSLG